MRPQKRPQISLFIGEQSFDGAVSGILLGTLFAAAGTHAGHLGVDQQLHHELLIVVRAAFPHKAVNNLLEGNYGGGYQQEKIEAFLNNLK